MFLQHHTDQDQTGKEPEDVGWENSPRQLIVDVVEGPQDKYMRPPQPDQGTLKGWMSGPYWLAAH